MRKFLSLILIASSIIVLAAPVFADSIDDTSSGGGSVEDLYKDVPKVENAFAGQKQITDEDFEKTYQKLKAKKDKRLKKNQPFKGQNLKEEDSGTYLQETDEKNLLLGLPVTLINQDGAEIPIGHYRIIGEKVNNKIFIDFYQSYTCVAKVPAVETSEDYGQKSINFVQLIPYSEKYIKLIYGSVDFNAYTYIPIKGGIASQDN
jgi:hypothetical protein